ncbi:MAG TPA: cyclodeaminase/cyclohydrolase family protein [Blastocatellia bacterium]|nr:cyclodeaminase/cyclohydrolase family protein [Blastocatellia bacterium]
MSATRLDGDEVLGSFAELVAAGTPAPGGGSVAAYCGMMAAALGRMVCNLTIGKPKFANRETRLKEVRGELERHGQRLRELIAEDAASFEGVLAAYRLPKETDEQKAARAESIQAAIGVAVSVPLETAAQSFEVLKLLREIADIGNPNAISDVAVGSQLAEVAIKGAGYNVAANLSTMSDALKADDADARMKALVDEAGRLAKQVEAKAGAQ